MTIADAIILAVIGLVLIGWLISMFSSPSVEHIDDGARTQPMPPTPPPPRNYGRLMSTSRYSYPEHMMQPMHSPRALSSPIERYRERLRDTLRHNSIIQGYGWDSQLLSLPNKPTALKLSELLKTNNNK